MSARITIRRGESIIIPADFGIGFDFTGWVFTCALKRCITNQVVPPASAPVLFLLPVLLIADAGLGRAGRAVHLSVAVTNVLEPDGKHYAFDIKGVHADGRDLVSPPVFIPVLERITP